MFVWDEQVRDHYRVTKSPSTVNSCVTGRSTSRSFLKKEYSLISLPLKHSIRIVKERILDPDWSRNSSLHKVSMFDVHEPKPHQAMLIFDLFLYWYIKSSFTSRKSVRVLDGICERTVNNSFEYKYQGRSPWRLGLHSVLLSLWYKL